MTPTGAPPAMAPDDRALWELSRRHSLHVLLAARIADGRSTEARSASMLAEARATLAAAGALEACRRPELDRLTRALAAAGVRTLVVKGAALAYIVYPQPHLRPRLDTDLLVDPCDRAAAEQVLHACGYGADVENVMPLAGGQCHFRRHDERGVRHAVDLHWRAASPLIFGDVLPFARAWARRRPIPSFAAAQTLAPPDALLLACVHRVAHHGADSALIWLHDIARLVASFSAEDWREFLQAADREPVRAAYARSLAQADQRAGLALPDQARRWLARHNGARLDPAFASQGVRPLARFGSDWRAAGSWPRRLQLLREHLLPPPAYIASRYGVRHAALLPWYYSQRALGGFLRWAVRGR